MVDFKVRLSEERAALLREVAQEDRRTINAIFDIGLGLYLGARNNWIMDANWKLQRVLPDENNG